MEQLHELIAAFHVKLKQRVAEIEAAGECSLTTSRMHRVPCAADPPDVMLPATPGCAPLPFWMSQAALRDLEKDRLGCSSCFLFLLPTLAHRKTLAQQSAKHAHSEEGADDGEVKRAKGMRSVNTFAI